MVDPASFKPPKLPLDGAQQYTGMNEQVDGEQSPSFVTPNASVFSPHSTKKNTMQEDTFGLRIFGRQQTKKMTAKLQNIKDLEAKKKLEEETEE